MLGPFEAKQFSDVEGAWAAAEEGEGLVDFARAHLSDVRSWLCALARSRFPSVRWQVYASLSGATGLPWAENILRDGLDDPDAYARRRAVLALSEHAVGDLGEIALALCHDVDPYMRRAAIGIAKAHGDVKTIQEVRSVLEKDPNELVRAALERDD